MPDLVVQLEVSLESRPSPRHWRPCLTTSVILLGCLFGIGYTISDWKWPAGAANGSGLSGGIPAPQKGRQTSRRFRVATFNIHGGCGTDGRVDLSRTAATLDQDFDFVGMNEVHDGNWTDSRSQAEQLGSLLNQGWLFAPTETTWSGTCFGQGVLSRLPVLKWRRVPFPRVRGNGFRNYVECQLPLNRSDSATHLTILVTHLDRRSDRQDQLRVIIQRFLEVPAPAILMGDLNSKRTEPQLIELTRMPGVVDCFGQMATGDLIRRRIDWIFARGLHCVTSNLELNDASDHPLGWAELELPLAVHLQ